MSEWVRLFQSTAYGKCYLAERHRFHQDAMWKEENVAILRKVSKKKLTPVRSEWQLGNLHAVCAVCVRECVTVANEPKIDHKRRGNGVDPFITSLAHIVRSDAALNIHLVASVLTNYSNSFIFPLEPRFSSDSKLHSVEYCMSS